MQHDGAGMAHNVRVRLGEQFDVVLHPDGTCEGAHDPRADGGAAGI